MTVELDPPHKNDIHKDTYCFTYEVNMIIQVIAPDKDIANIKLDRDGGYVSKREVSLKSSILIDKGSEPIKNNLPNNKKG